MRHPLAIFAAVLIPLAATAEVPKVFAGLLEEGVPTRGEVGIPVPPQEYHRYAAKIAEAARADPKWFLEFSGKAKPGVPLPYDPKLGLTQAEHAEYLKLWSQREFKRQEEVLLLLRKNSRGAWTITATGSAGAVSTLQYKPDTDTFTSPNGELKRIADVKADPDTILGAWTGKEWKFQDESTLGKSKENVALGKLEKTGHGLIVYRFQEVTSEGTPVVDRSVVIRFMPGKGGQAKAPATKPTGKPAGKPTPKR